MCSADNKPEFWLLSGKPGPGAGQPLVVDKGTQIPQEEGLGMSKERMEVQPVLWHPLKCCCSDLGGGVGGLLSQSQQCARVSCAFTRPFP